ncbi:MAG: hypothetical protein U1F36_15985 [Planctomycetota bacterium]
MKSRRLWAVSALDLVFLVLGSVLLVAQGFERGLDHLRIDLPLAAGGDGHLAADAKVFTLALDLDGIHVDGATLAPTDLAARAQDAREHGADQAVVASAPRVTAGQLVPVLAALRDAGFSTIRIPFQKEQSR